MTLHRHWRVSMHKPLSDEQYVRRSLLFSCRGPHELSCGCVVCTRRTFYRHERMCGASREIYADYGVSLPTFRCDIEKPNVSPLAVDLIYHFLLGMSDE